MANMIPISTVTVGSGGAATIDFVGIPQIYTDLKLVYSTRCSTTSNRMYYDFNGSTANQTARFIYADGSGAASTTDTRHWIYGEQSAYTSNTFANGEIYIPNYTSSNNKSSSSDSVNENNASAAYSALSANLWSSTAPISSISLSMAAGNFAQYSTATLYGIRKY